MDLSENPSPAMKILIFGASGSGTSTLGKALASQLSCPFFDADDYYWEKTVPAFQRKIPLEKRNALLMADFSACASAVLSGSMVTWGKQWRRAFDFGIFLFLPPEIRLQRLADREAERYGATLDSDPQVQADSRQFLEWAAQYDDPDFEGRSITQHRQWMEVVEFPVLRLEGDFSTEHRISRVLEFAESLPTKM